MSRAAVIRLKGLLQRFMKYYKLNFFLHRDSMLRTLISKIPLLFLLTTISWQPALAADSFTDKETRFVRDFERFVRNRISKNVPGMALAIVVNGEVVLLKGYGVKNIRKKDAITENTVFRIASVSKTFASAAIAVLVQKNILAWDSRVIPYLNDVSFKNKAYAQQLRIEHLLSHSSGLTPHAYTNLLNQNVSYEDIKSLIEKVDFICRPGSCYSYQNVIYSLLGDIVDFASVDGYEAYVANNLFVPLQMHNASFGWESFIKSDNAATPHVPRRGKWSPVRVKPNYYEVAPAAGVNASITDMSKWLLAQLGARPDVLSRSVLDAMHSKHIKTTKHQAHYGQWEGLNSAHYGLGWRVFDYRNVQGFAHHGGWVKGFRSEIVLNKALNLGMVLLVNAERSNVNKAVPKFLDLAYEYGLIEREEVTQ